VVLAGHSMGGTVSLLAAAAAPDKPCAAWCCWTR
jgi:pimeloyl-ACP methyl ester carboxylesterase